MLRAKSWVVSKRLRAFQDLVQVFEKLVRDSEKLVCAILQVVTWASAGLTGQADGTEMCAEQSLKLEHNQGGLKYPKVSITVLKSVL